MRTARLFPLLLVVALAIPCGDGGPRPAPLSEVCTSGGVIHSGLGPGAGEERRGGGHEVASFGAATSGPAEGASGPNKGPRRDPTAALRRALATPAVFSTSSPTQGILLRDSSRDPERSGFTAHPSTAPPRHA